MAKRTPSPKPAVEENQKVIELEVNAEVFTNADYEVMEDWSRGNKEGHTTKEIFDILDRIIVGGFRHRPFVDIKPTIKAVLGQIGQAAMGENSKN